MGMQAFHSDLVNQPALHEQVYLHKCLLVEHDDLFAHHYELTQLLMVSSLARIIKNPKP